MSGRVLDAETGKGVAGVTVVKTDVSISPGATAQAADLAISPSYWFLQLTGVSTDLNAVHFVNTYTGWAATNLGHILRTANGGASWTVFGQAPGAINRFAFADDNVGFGIANGGVVYRTADGGKTWVTQALAAGLTTDLYDQDVKSPTVAWAVGKGGRVFKYWLHRSLDFASAERALGRYRTVALSDETGQSPHCVQIAAPNPLDRARARGRGSTGTPSS